jgi:molybdopterin converting factor small subunit
MFLIDLFVEGVGVNTIEKEKDEIENINKDKEKLIEEIAEKITELKKEKEKKLRIKNYINKINTQFGKKNYDVLKDIIEIFIDNNIDKIDIETPIDDILRIALSISYYYLGVLYENEGGLTNINKALENYYLTINIGKNPSIDGNKVLDAYTRIKNNAKFIC